ncbi:MAG: cysteine--tRNA ligase [Gemmatimonadetes bacterium]|nr:cysteine--tRNA ligase [Gemmatimonadota bacterium]
MSLRLYNTLTRRVDPFEPLAPPRVTLYTCGPTVWNFAHIGNFRTFLFEDLLRRYLEYSGYDVFQIMNLTDVDDRTIQAAAKAGVVLTKHTEPFTQAFFEDRDYLRIKPAHVYTRATAYIGPMVELVQQLLDCRIAYRSEDGSVYYAVGKFDTYGRLSQLDKRELKAGARVASDEYAKDNVQDFALWKAAVPEDEKVGAAWDTPFGRGRPGWHLECSAMALTEIRSRFGIETLDIHAGGVDLIFPHHENEIAQSEGATGRTFARHWMHGEFLTVEGTKMSKRFGNFLTARDLREEGLDPAAFRRLVFLTHYRQQLSFSDAGLRAAQGSVTRLGEFRDRLVLAARTAKADLSAGNELETQFRAAMDDDLNAPEAMAAVFSFVTNVNRELDAGAGPEKAAGWLKVFDRTMDVLDVTPRKAAVAADLAAWVAERIAARQQARKAGDYAAADAIRGEIAARGIELEDTPAGPRWKKRDA